MFNSHVGFRGTLSSRYKQVLVSTHLKKISQIKSFPQGSGWKQKNIWNHHRALICQPYDFWGPKNWGKIVHPPSKTSGDVRCPRRLKWEKKRKKGRKWWAKCRRDYFFSSSQGVNVNFVKMIGEKKQQTYSPNDDVTYMAVSENRGTPKSSTLIRFSTINHPFWGTIIFGNTHIFWW